MKREIRSLKESSIHQPKATGARSKATLKEEWEHYRLWQEKDKEEEMQRIKEYFANQKVHAAGYATKTESVFDSSNTTGEVKEKNHGDGEINVSTENRGGSNDDNNVKRSDEQDTADDSLQSNGDELHNTSNEVDKASIVTTTNRRVQSKGDVDGDNLAHATKHNHGIYAVVGNQSKPFDKSTINEPELGRPVTSRLYPYPTKSKTRRGAPRMYLRYLNEELSKDQLASWKDKRNEHETKILKGEKSITVEDVRSFVYSFNYAFQWGYPQKHTSICCTLDDFCIDTILKAQKVYCHIPVHLDGDDGQPSHMVGLTVAFPKRKILIFDPKNGSDTHDVVRKVTNAVDKIPNPFTNNKFEVVNIANCLNYKEDVDSALYVSFFFECISRKVDLLTELKLGLDDKWSCVERRLSYFLFYVCVGRNRYSMEHKT